MKSAGKARNNGLYRHIRTSKEIIRNLLNDSKKKNQPTHVLVDSNPAFEEPSMILLEQIFTIDKSRIERFIGYATPGKCLVSQCNQTVPQRCCSRSDSLICSGLHFKKQPGFFFIVERG